MEHFSRGALMEGNGGAAFLPEVIGWRKLLRRVRLSDEAVAAFCRRIAEFRLEVPRWARFPFYPPTDETTVDYFFFANAVNFSYFAFPGETKWRISYKGEVLDGAMALFGAFTRAVERGELRLAGDALARMTGERLRSLFAGNVEIPMFEERLRFLQTTGEILCEAWDGHFCHLLEEAGRSVARAIELVVRDFPPFHDTVRHRGVEIPFLKRLQLSLAMIHGRFSGMEWGAFDDIERLTLFADYKLPQILRHHGILHYDDALRALVDHEAEVPAGSEGEIEIRLATLVAGEEIRKRLSEAEGRHVNACQIDFLLWNEGQRIDKSALAPYHRTRTTAY